MSAEDNVARLHREHVAARDAAERAAASLEDARAALPVAERVLLEARPADAKAYAALVSKRDFTANALRIAGADHETAKDAEDIAFAAWQRASREATYQKADAAIIEVGKAQDEVAVHAAAIAALRTKQHEIYFSAIQGRNRPKADYPGASPRFASLEDVLSDHARGKAALSPLAVAMRASTTTTTPEAS